MSEDRMVAPMVDLSAPDSQLRSEMREMLREELRRLLADPAELRAVLFARPALPPFAGGTCPTLGTGPSPSVSNRLAKWSDGNCNMGNSVLFDDGTNLAIGTTTPNATFDIHVSTPGMMLSGSGAAFVLADGSWVTQGRFGSETGASAGPFMSSDVSGHVLKFYMTDGTGTNEKMRLTSDGKVGIGTGTNTPSAKLHVKDGSVLSEFNYGSDGDLRNVVLNQLDSSLRRTSIGFKWDNSGSPQEQYLLGADLFGSNAQRNFFLYDSIQDRPLEIWISPLGGSNDDQPQIQAAVDLLAAKSPPGGIIRLAPGVFRIENTIAIKGNGIKLRGAGGAPNPTLFTATGTVSFSNGSATVTGSGTHFTTEIAVGDTVYVQVGATQQNALVSSITSDTQLTVGAAFTITGSGRNMQVFPAAVPAVTRLLWTPMSSGTIVQLKPALTNAQLQDLELSDLTLDGGGHATIGLLLDRIYYSKFINLSIRNGDQSISTGIKLTTTADGGNDHANTHQGNDTGTSFNHFELCSIQDWVTGLHLTQEATNAAVANSCHNTFISLNIQGGPVVTGIKLEACDNNSFYRVFSGATTGVLIVDPNTAYDNYFFHLEAGGGLKVTGTSGQGVTTFKNHVIGYDQANGEPNPTTDSNPVTNFLFWINSKGQIQGQEP